VISALWVTFAVALGCALVYRYGQLDTMEPRWARILIVFGAGSAAGMGLTSCLFFLCRLAAPSTPRLAMGFEIAAMAWLVFQIWKHQQSAAPHARSMAVLLPGLMGALAVAFLVGTIAVTGTWDSNPQGGWDAWSIWNLRARFLAEGTLPQRAWSSLLTSSHPEYPLLLSSFVARSWAFAGSASDTGPIITSYLFFLALLATLTGGFAIYRGRSTGLLIGLALLGAPALMHEVAGQYADIPVACYMACATIFVLLERPLLAGLFAGLAAWTKDEGALFLVAFFVLLALTRREQLRYAAIGVMPGAAVTALFKLALAPAGPLYAKQTAAEFVHRLIDPARFWQVLTAFAHEFSASGMRLYHPILPIIVLAAGLGFDRKRRKDALFAVALLVIMTAGYVGTLLITPLDLKWQLDTAVSRLVVQLWPALLIAAFAGMNGLEKAITEPAPVQPKLRKKAKA